MNDIEVTDFHVHVWEKVDGSIAGGERTASATYGNCHIGQELTRWMPPSFVDSAATPEVFIRYMDWAGVDKAVLMQAPGYGFFNARYAQLLDDYPDRFIAAFGLADPREGEKGVKELEEVVTVYNLVGVKFQVADTQFVLDDEQYFPFWEKLAELGAIAAFDMAIRPDDPYGWQIEALERVVERFGDAKFILLHLGTPSLPDVNQVYPFPDLQRTLQLGEYPNVWFELGGIPWMCRHEEYPYERGQEMVRAAVEKVGAERIMWGSDWPCTLRQCTYQQQVDIVRKHCESLTPKQKEDILSRTAHRVLGLGE